LFTLSFGQLFLCFAPFAFFIRLIQRKPWAIFLTMAFGVFVTGLKTNSLAAPPTLPLVLGLMLARTISSWLSVYFYFNGGVLLVWWWTLLLQIRVLVELEFPG